MGEEWLGFASDKGPLWVFFLIVITGLVKYVPKLVQKHMETLDSVQKTQAESAVAMKAIGQRVEITGKFDAAAHRAAYHLGDALVKLAPEDREASVRSATSQMIRELHLEDTPDRG